MGDTVRTGWYHRYGKRTLDLLGAATGLILTAPIMLSIAAAVWLTIGRPIVFAQRRPGKHGEEFSIFKFRSMRDEIDEAGAPLPDAARLTPFGTWMRRWSLDELPELFNVIRGEMSLVGPRPLLSDYLERYTAEQARRHEERPGITGWAQVNGRNRVTWEEKFEMDVWYVDNLSLGLDMRILARTISQVLTGHAVSAEGHATMPRFDEPEGDR